MEQVDTGRLEGSFSFPLPQEFAAQVKHLPLKRSFDILFSLFALVAVFPLCLIIFVAIRLSSKGPVIYSHQRVGRGGKLFRCFKFRTMRTDADEVLEEILANDSTLREDWNKRRKLSIDPRVTAIGRFLRKTSMDELPQFYNVLVGDMSVVGPRPVCCDEIEQFYGPRAYKILQLRPGITGCWQTSGHCTRTYEQRVDLDESYVDGHNFLWDLYLILRTIPRLFWPSNNSS